MLNLFGCLHLFGKRLKDIVGKTEMFGKYTCGKTEMISKKHDTNIIQIFCINPLMNYL